MATAVYNCGRHLNSGPPHCSQVGLTGMRRDDSSNKTHLEIRVLNQERVTPLTDVNPCVTEDHVEIRTINKEVWSRTQGPHKGSLNHISALMNSLILLMGLATLSSPYAIARSGWIGVLACMAVASLYWHATTLLFKCMEETDADSYMTLAKIVFPKWGHKVVSFLFYLETFGTLVGFFISIGDMATRALPILHHMGFHMFKGRDISIVISFLMVLPLTWQRLSLTYISSTICNIALLVVIGCVLSIGITSTGFNYTISYVSSRGLFEAFGIFSFAFGATPVFPSIYASHGKSKSFKKILFVSFGIATSVYIVLGVTGAIMFGHSTKSIVTTNLSPSLPSTIANWIGILIPVTKFPLLAAPVLIDLEKWKVVEGNMFYKTLLRSFAILMVLLVAIFIPHFSTVIELVGSSLTIGLCTIIPIIFYLKLSARTFTKGPSPDIGKKIFLWVILLLNIAIAIGGTVRSILTATTS